VLATFVFYLNNFDGKKEHLFTKKDHVVTKNTVTHKGVKVCIGTFHL